MDPRTLQFLLKLFILLIVKVSCKHGKQLTHVRFHLFGNSSKPRGYIVNPKGKYISIILYYGDANKNTNYPYKLFDKVFAYILACIYRKRMHNYENIIIQQCMSN